MDGTGRVENSLAAPHSDTDPGGKMPPSTSGKMPDATKQATSSISGLLGADCVLNLRWQSKTAEVTRRSLVTVDTVAAAQVTPIWADVRKVRGTALKGYGIAPTFAPDGTMTDPGDPWLPDI